MTNDSHCDALVSVEWLSTHLNDPDVIILDASVPPVVPGYVQINSTENFRAIPGALRFDYDKKICDLDSNLPHMMPSESLFTAAARTLGINRHSKIVIYDDVGVYASPRAWWMFKAMGHDSVAVLDGGLPAWLENGLPCTNQLIENNAPGDFLGREQDGAFVTANQVLTLLSDSNAQVLDARSAGRFHGTAAEPRPGMRSGHMPGAASLPFPEVLDGKFFKSKKELEQLFLSKAKQNQFIVTSCGSGLTACVLTLAAYLAGFEKLGVYDGSWAQWGQPGELPVVCS